MDADSAWDRLVAESGDDVDIATMVAQSNIEDAQKALDKAKKQTPKLVGTTEEKLAAAKAFKESVVKAQNDLAKWQEIADVPKRRASLQAEQAEQTESQGQQVADKLPASEEVGPTETTPVEEVAQIEESAPIEEQTKGDASTMSQETDQVSDQVEEEKDIIEELRERLRVGNERDQRAGRPPRPSDFIEAIGKGDDKAMKAWEGEFNDYAQKLNADDLPDIESTIRQMQGHIDTIRSGNPKGYKDNSAYKAYSGIKKMLEKRRRELNKQSAEGNTRLSAMSGVGLVEDARTRTLGDKTRKMFDAMAKRLGLQVEFVDEIVTGKDEKGRNTYANADIVGNKVRIAWDKRDQALDFLLGHEFTHRMQALSPEAYAEFVEATKQALGEEEWNKRINRMKSLYKQHGIAISEQGIIDEVVADYAGELVEERGVFDNFVERNKNNRGLLSKIADVLRSIKEFFTLGKQRKINNAITRLEALIESASEANKNTQKSLIEEARLQIKQKMSDLQKAETTIKGWVENKKRGKSFEIKLPTQTQKMVKRAMGKDYDSHNITANGIAHGFNNHGERGKKLGPNSIPVRKEDAVLIPYIMTAPDRVEKGSTDVRNRESVRFYKNLSNGYIVVVEKERINSSDDMETISFWIEMSSEATNAQRNVVPDINVRNAILSTDVAKIRKDAETAIEKDVENSVKAQYSLQGAFYSNAHHAVEDIKQDKATPQQWIAMLKKNGGLKAGEDKWLGLEDWLNTQQGSVTKQDIIDYINENSIKIEEVEYGEESLAEYKYLSNPENNDFDLTSEGKDKIEARFGEFDFEYMPNEYFKFNGTLEEQLASAIEANNKTKHVDDRFYDLQNEAERFISDVEGEIMHDIDYWIFDKKDETIINETRLEYTTEGLDNKGEIALTIPTIDPYNESDEIHFGDAGDGRAVAWIRFGETEDAEGNRVLVIDEIQSKRHQDGREKGYRDSNHHEQFENARKAYANAAKAHSDFVAEMKEKYGDPMAVRGTAEERKEARKAWKMQWSVEELGKYDELTDKIHDARKVYDAISDRRSGVPDAPFEKNWQELAMKRMLRYATDFGFDKLAWTTGEQQAKRYDIGNVVNSIEYKIDTDGSYLIDTYGSNGYQIDAIPTNFANENEVSEVFGKDLSGKIVNDLKEQKEKIDALKQKKQALREQMRGMDENSAEYDNPLAEYSKIIKEISDAQEPIRLEGDGLRVGGEGMKGFYDKMLPSFMNKYGKKWGVKVGEVTMPNLEEGYQTMHSVDITDAMREDVRKGQPLFSLQGNSMTDEEQRIVDEAKANGTYLKAPNGKQSNLNERQWIQVRTKAFKDWFGDWELAAKVVKIISANMEHGFKNFAEARKWAKENLLGTYINPEIGEIVVSGKAIDKYLSGKAVEQSHSRDAHLSALQVLPKLIENSIVGEIHEDRDKNSNIKDIVRLFGAMNIGNETSRVKITVKRYSDNNTPNKAYTYEVTEIEPLDGHWTTHAQNADFVPTSNDSITGAKLLKGIENSKGLPILNYSKIVDENGEPMIAYHSGNEGINVFSREFDKQGIGRQFWGKGFYFGTAKSKDEWSRRYKEKTEKEATQYAVFLNIKNPTYSAINGEVKDSDYDGVILPPKRVVGGETDYMYIVADPTQIKSATDNVGTFDASNPDIRYSLFGGNSGYVGYSMSKRAARAREEGRYPKTDFRKEYGVTAKSFDELVDAKIIASGEWHHTSKFGNETKFYHWVEDYYADIYEENKAVIDKLSRERKTDEIVSLFENHPLAHKAEYDNETERLVDDVNREYNDKIREVENEKRDKERAYNSAVFDALGQLTNVVKANNGNLWFNASNGVGIQIDRAGNEVSMNYGGANGSKGALRYEARNELQTAIESVAKESNIESADATYYTDKVNQLEAERAELVAQLVETREKEYTPEARYSLASDMARDAVMTALEGAGIDVEMATPEMVEDVLRAREVVELSKRSEEREQTNRWIDEATAFVSGKSIKEARQERIRKERERKELAKEIYENVLSGNFNEVTLQKINQYIDETTPRNPYGRRLSQRLPQRVEREMYENQRENAVDALYSRISESSVPANGRFSESGRREIESRKKEALKGWAIATGNWHTDLSAFTNQTEPIGVGTDSKVYVSKDGKHVIKASKGKPYGKRFRPDIDNIPLFNSVFKNSAYEIVGYGEIDGEFVRILKQPIVDFANSTPLTEDERVEYMRSLGFEPLNKENTAFSNGEIVVSDLQKSNIVKDVDGNIRVIDADAKLHTKDVGGNYEYLPVEYDLPSAEFHIAYHGSGAKFDEFDHSHMGEGEGAQAYGWGTYLTEVEGIAKGYATSMRDKNISEKYRENAIINNLVRQTLASSNKEEALEYLRNLLNEKWSDKKRVKAQIKIIETGKFLPETKIKAQLYFVEIPDDNGSNYLDYDKEMSKKELNEVRNKLEAILAEGDYKGVEKELKRELDSVFVDGLTASDVYGNVSAYLGGDKQASEFFNEMDYVGIKYPANYRSGGNEDGKKNFVIFNESDMKITDRVEFLQTSDGTVYGWTIGGKIFLTEQGMNAETPIHEYTHLWANAMRRNNEQGWESVKDLLRGTPMWDEVLADKNYSNIHDNEDLVASEVLSRYSGKENAKRLEDEAQRMIGEAKGIGAKADAVSLIDRVRRALQKFWDWVGKDLFGIEKFDSIEEVSDRVLYDLMNQTNLNAEVSEGEGPFGKIYRQFKGKAKEAFDYLMKVKKGDALGVYNRKGIGDIDLVWGDKNGGLAHIISKHIGKGKSFANIEDAQNSISDIINNGKVIFENGDKVVISKNGKIVTLRKNFRVKGKKIADKNWILTAYNENAADNTSAISGINQGQAAPTTAISADKGNTNSSDVQAKSEKGAQFSLQGGRSIADKYEKRVNTKGKGGAMHLSKFNFMEAWQDEMRALKEAQRIIEQEYDIVLESYEDAYMAENALSSVNQAEWERYIKDYYEPMMEIIDKWILKGGETEQTINHYLIAKSGLERNREFTVRDAFAEMDKMDRQIINGAYSGTVLKLANALRQGQISQDEYDAQVQEAKDKKAQALENIKASQQRRVNQYKDERNTLRGMLQRGEISYEEFNQLSDKAALRHANVAEIRDYSGLTALAKQHNEKDWRNFAEQMVANFENKHDNTDVLWERINNATKKAVEKSYESGITSKEAKDHLDQMFLWYVPMGGMENDTAEDIYSYLNRNADSAFTQTVKRAEGHSEHISDDVMAMIANTMQSAILQGNRNKMKQKFLNMVQNYPTDLFTLDRGWLVLKGNEWVEVFPDINENDTPEEVRSVLPHQFYNLQIFYILLIDYKTNNRSLIMPTLLPGCSRIYVQ